MSPETPPVFPPVGASFVESVMPLAWTQHVNIAPYFPIGKVIGAAPGVMREVTRLSRIWSSNRYRWSRSGPRLGALRALL